MKRFVARFESLVSGVLSGFDRLVFRGHLLSLMRPRGMHDFLFAAHQNKSTPAHQNQSTLNPSPWGLGPGWTMRPVAKAGLDPHAGASMEPKASDGRERARQGATHCRARGHPRRLGVEDSERLAGACVSQSSCEGRDRRRSQ